MARLHPTLEPFTPTSDEPFDSTKVAHLLHRAGFGATLDEIELYKTLGPKRAAEKLLDFPELAAEEQGSDVPDLSGIDGYPNNFAERRKLFEGKTPQERQDLNNMLQRANREAVLATAQWWLKRMTAGPNPLQEKLTLFWHGHFTTSARDERSAWLMWQQNETLRRNAAGNFGTFVKQISRDPAMLDYLNNQQNRKGSPNENYARELMELFTLGIGEYTEADIKEAARAFTGWGHDGEAFLFRKSLHDAEKKKFFGLTGEFDGDDVIDIILKRPECANYIAAKLFRFFAYENVDPALLTSLGNVLREEKYELRPTLFTLFTSKAFYSPAAIGTQIKSPVHLITSGARLMGMDTPTKIPVMGVLEQMGQVPLNPPNVKGWPGGRSWINTSTLFVRYNTSVAMVGRIPEKELRPAGAKSNSEIVDHWLARLIQRPVVEEKRKTLETELGSRPDNAAIRRMIELIVSMPEYQLC
jgi:uncharacterized protein (DUF1800 family)